MVDGGARVEALDLPHGLGQGPEAEGGEVLAHLLGDVLEERLHELRLAVEARSQGSGFCVATPTGQVSRWQTRIMMQPDTTSGAVAKPYSSAPRSAAMITSRPVFIWPSVCTTMRSRSPLRRSVCWVSARPSSHGAPACFSELSGLAPVPPSWPEMSTTSAFAFDTPAATVPTPTSATSFTCTRAAGLAFLRSWMSCLRSSME